MKVALLKNLEVMLKMFHGKVKSPFLGGGAQLHLSEDVCPQVLQY